VNSNYKLFSVETNIEPESIAVSHDKNLSDVMDVYSLPQPDKVTSLSKRNPLSEIYRSDTDAGAYILRRATPDSGEQLELQCAILHKLSDGLSIRPLRNKKNKYVTFTDGICWVCYPMVPGLQYDGDHTKLSYMLKKAIQLCSELQNIYDADSGVRNLKKLSYAPENWSAMWAWIFGEPISDFHATLQASLPASLKQNISSARAIFTESLDQSCELPVNYTLVHYDLQHANIISGKNGSITFIDLEDIYLSDTRLALYHGVFKWIRHSIYMNSDYLPDAIRWLKHDCLRILSDEFGRSHSTDEIYRYVIFRTLSDIYNLMDSVIRNGKVEYLYDLEKKLSNMLEIYTLFSVKRGGI